MQKMAHFEAGTVQEEYAWLRIALDGTFILTRRAVSCCIVLLLALLFPGAGCMACAWPVRTSALDGGANGYGAAAAVLL